MTDNYRIEIQVDSTSAVNASRNLNLLSGSVNSAERSLVSMIGTVKMAGMALLGLAGVSFGKAISEMASFETKLLNLKALTMANTEEMKQMEKQARSLGATTAFSAQQAAEAQGVLASAGLKVNEIISATPKVLQLAAAGNLDLAKAAEVATGTMKALGLGISDLQRINDVFATVAANSATNVQEIGEAMKNAAPLSRAFGVSLEMTSAAIGIAADNQIKGSEAGNNYKTMLLALGNDTKEHIEIVKKHGLTYADLDVKTRGLDAVMLSLGKANLSGAEALKLFGSDAAALGLILSANAEKLKEDENGLHNVTGAAENQSDILNQGLSKAWDALIGTLGEAAQQFGEAGARIDETGKATGGLKVGLTDLITAASGVISIYEGMGEQFKASNKYTDEQFHHLEDVAGALKIVAGGATGIAVLTGALWSANTAAKAFNASLILIGRHPIMAMAGVVAGAYGAATAAQSDSQSAIDKQIETAEKKLKMFGGRSFLLRPFDFDEQKERTKLTALKQYKEDQIALSQKQATATNQETEAQKALDKKLQDVEALRLKSQNGYSAPEDKKAVSAAQREHNKELESYKRLIESTPIGKYRADMNELNNALKKGGIDQITYNDLTVKAAAEYEKATVGIEKLTEAEKERQRIFDQTPRGKFEKSTDELRAQKPFMSSSDYLNKQDEIGVSYLKDTGQNTQAKTQVEQATEAAKKYEEQIKKTTTANYELGSGSKMAFDGILGGISSVAAAFTDFGSVIEKNATTFKAVQDEYDKNMKMQGMDAEKRANLTAQFAKEKLAYESATTQAEISGARSIAGATAQMFSEKSTARKAFHGIEMGLSVIEMAMSAKKMVVDLAAGAAAMFGQSGWAGFAGVTAMMAVMAGFGITMSGGSKTIDMVGMKPTGDTGTVKNDSAAASNSIMDSLHLLNEVGASQLNELKDLNSNITSLAKGVTNVVTDAIKIHGAFIPSTVGMSAPNKNPLGSTGMIAGSLGASIAMGAAGVGTSIMAGVANAAISAGLTSVGGALGGAATAMAGTAISTGMALGATASSAMLVGGAVLGLAGGLIIAGLQYGLGKLLGIGKTKFEVIGNGIVTNVADMTLGGMKEAVVAYDYSTIKATTKGWISDTKKIYDQINGVDNEISNALTSVFGTLGKSLGSAFALLGIGDLAHQSAVVPMLKFDLSTAKTDQEISDVITKAINTMSDKLATEMAGGLFAQYQKAGEGMLATIGRVATEFGTVSHQFNQLGIDLHLSGMAGVAFSDTLVQLYESVPNANDGLKNFLATIKSFTDLVLTPTQKVAVSAKNWTDFATKYNAQNDTNLSTNFSDIKRDDLYKVLSSATDKLQSASATQGALDSKAQIVQDATAPTTAFDQSQLDMKAWANKVNVPFANMTSDSVTTQMLAIIKAGAAGNDQYKALWTEILRVMTTNDAKKAAGQVAISTDSTLAPYFNGKSLTDGLAAYTAAQQSAAAATKSAALGVSDLTNEADIAKAGLDFYDKTLSLQEGVLKQITAALDTTQRSREKELLTLDNTIDIRGKLDAKTIAAFDKWNNSLPAATKNLVLTQNALQKFSYSLEDLAKLKDASAFMVNFSSSVSTWVQNQKVTQLGSTQTQLQAAGAAFDSMMLRINLPTSATDKQDALGKIIQIADSYMTAIKNFYGSSKAGTDLLQGVIDKVSVLPDSVDIQSLILGKLEEIRTGIVATPTFSNTLTSANTSIISQLATDIKAAVDKNLTAPTLANAQVLNANAQVMLTLQNISAMTNSTDGIFLNQLITAIGSGTGLKATINATINSQLDPITKQAAVDALTNSLAAIQVDITKFKANPTPDSLARLQSDISSWAGLTANVNAAVSKLTLDPTNPTLKASVQSALASINDFSANISGLQLSPSAIKAANDSISALTPPPVKMAITVPPIDTSPFSALGQTVDSTTLKINNMAQALVAVGAAGTNAQNQAGFVGPVVGGGSSSLGSASSAIASIVNAGSPQYKTGYMTMSSTGLGDFFDSKTSDSLQAIYEKEGSKKTATEISAIAGAFQTMLKNPSNALNNNLSYVVGYNNTHPDNSIDMAYQPFAANLVSIKNGERMTSFATKDASGKPLAQSVIDKNQAAAMQADYDSAKLRYDQAMSFLNTQKISYYEMMGYNQANPSMMAFATGGAFTNGIVNRPTAFDMGLMGEAGSEGILPLHNIGGSLGVKAILPASNDSGNNEEEIAELKAQNRILIEQNAILREGFLQLIAENKAQNQSLRSIKITSKEKAFK